MGVERGFFDFFGVGINHYPAYSSLDYAADDCLKLGRTLDELRLTNSKRILADGSSDGLPIRTGIYKHVRAFLRLSEVSRPKLFYFAGHGASLHNAMHICPRDYDPAVGDKTSIDISEIVDEFSGRSPWSLFILDCCRAPLFEKEASTLSDRKPLTGGIRISDNSIVMSACSNGQFAAEAASIKGGVGGGIFTHHLVEALKRYFGPRGRKRISVGDLFAKARDDTSAFVSDISAKDQIPIMLGAQGTEFFIISGK